MNQCSVISIHPGRQHNLEQAAQLAKRVKDFKHVTTLYFEEKTVSRWSKFSKKIGRALKKRSGILDKKYVDTKPIFELRLILQRDILHNISPTYYRRRNYLFQQWVINKYAPPKICIGFDTSSWLLFEKWKNKSFLILDLSIAVPQYKLHLAKEYGQDEEFVKRQTQDDNSEKYKIYEKELGLADLILCGSDFVRQSCLSIGIDPAKLMLLPYGADLIKFHIKKQYKLDNKLVKIAFVGAFGYRKGADIILKAWQYVIQKYPFVQLHIYGGVQIEVHPEIKGVFLHGFIMQDLLVEELSNSDISILPTFFEGSSLAVYQSMAMGLPVVTTANAGSIIQDQKNGVIIPYGSVQYLIEALELLITKPLLRRKLGLQAQQDIMNYSWDDYGNKLRLIIEKAISSNVVKMQ